MTPPKKLKLVQAFDRAKSFRTQQDQTGYEKVDDDRVLERYFQPLLWEKLSSGVTMQLMTSTLFDFKSYTATVSTMTMNGNQAVQGEPSHVLVPFSAFENKRAIVDAHRALIELGGDPGPIDDIINNELVTRRPIAPMKPAQFSKK
ncbi:MAG: hypothetical protein PW788_13230 [Micavibrio sp.]|nr:hypothetical protein [Micavibrio sp.]